MRCAKHFFNGDILKAREIQLKFKEFIDALFMEASPIPLKSRNANFRL